MLCENHPESERIHSILPDNAKRKTRRARKGRNKIRKLESVLKGIQNKECKEEEIRLFEDHVRSERLSSECKHSLASRKEGSSSLPKRPNTVFLRPTNVPLLNAPKNSTQFIIDDHENSNLFLNFHDSENEDVCHTPGSGDFNGPFEQDDQMSPDDDSYWVEYSERDFQTVYETAHQEKIAEWSRKRLVGEISYLEKRQRNLLNSLSLVDPHIYLQKLQSELLSLQEDNRKLRMDLFRSKGGKEYEEVPDSTSLGTDQGGSSSSSDEEQLEAKA